MGAELVAFLARVVERQVELEYVDARLAVQAQHASVRVREEECLHGRAWHSAGPCHAAGLVLGAGEADVRVQPAGRRGDQVNRDGLEVAGIRGT